jgi:hypothetical protein
MVRVNATITAWYTDPGSGKSGYQVLPSNGRLESDFLDRLQEALGDQASPAGAAPRPNLPPSASRSPSNPPGAVRTPAPDAAASAGSRPSTGSPFKLGDPLSPDHMSSSATQKAVIDPRTQEQSKEVKGLEEILHNQAHPANLVAVKKSSTPVLANPIENAKVLFLAAAEDEFEMLDANSNWVHVRISGLSRTRVCVPGGYGGVHSHHRSAGWTGTHLGGALIVAAVKTIQRMIAGDCKTFECREMSGA